MWTVEEQATALIGKADGWRMKKKRRRFADCDQALASWSTKSSALYILMFLFLVRTTTP